jgi:hypothetical protein
MWKQAGLCYAIYEVLEILMMKGFRVCCERIWRWNMNMVLYYVSIVWHKKCQELLRKLMRAKSLRNFVKLARDGRRYSDTVRVEPANSRWKEGFSVGQYMPIEGDVSYFVWSAAMWRPGSGRHLEKLFLAPSFEASYISPCILVVYEHEWQWPYIWPSSQSIFS